MGDIAVFLVEPPVGPWSPPDEIRCVWRGAETLWVPVEAQGSVLKP